MVILKRIWNLLFGLPSMCVISAIVGLVICSFLLLVGLREVQFVAVYLAMNLILMVTLFVVPPGRENFYWTLLSLIHSIAHIGFYIAIYRQGIAPGYLMVIVLLSLGNSGNIIEFRESLHPPKKKDRDLFQNATSEHS
jgi:hypothetical protein